MFYKAYPVQNLHKETNYFLCMVIFLTKTIVQLMNGFGISRIFPRIILAYQVRKKSLRECKMPEFNNGIKFISSWQPLVLVFSKIKTSLRILGLKNKKRTKKIEEILVEMNDSLL